MGNIQNLGVVKPVPKGDWNKFTTYKELNIVKHNGESYIAITTSIGIAPGITSGWKSYWQLITSGLYSELLSKTQENTNNIQSIQFSVNQNKEDIQKNQSVIEQNKEDIQKNQSVIEQNKEDILYAKKQILQNEKNITNLFAITAANGLYAIRKKSQAYTSRVTAEGENIIDGQYTPVNLIAGDTVKTVNLLNLNAFELGAFDPTTGFPVESTSQFRITYKIPCSANTDIVQSNNQSLTCRVFFYGDDDSFISTEAMYANTSITAPVGTSYLKFQTGAIGSVDILLSSKYQLEYGTTPTTYVPYFSGLKHAYFKAIKSTGKNVFNEEYVKGAYGALDGNFSEDSAYVANKEKIKVIGGQSYYIYYEAKTTEHVEYVIYYDKNGKYISYIYTPTAPFVVPSNCAYINIDIYNGGTALTIDDVGKCMVTMSSVAKSDYVPYAGEHLFELPETLEMPKWVTLNPQTGELTNGNARIEFDGSEDWFTERTETAIGGTGYRIAINLSDFKVTADIDIEDEDIIVNMYNIITAVETWLGNKIGASSGGKDIMYVYDPKYCATNDISLWKAHLAELYAAGTPLIIEYKKATPTVTMLDNIPKSYKAYKGGSETVVQGETDNSKYGAMPEITQEYFKLVGGGE